MLRKKKALRKTHSGSLILERAGLRTESGIVATPQFLVLIPRFKKAGMEVVGARHSKYCLCGDGRNEIVPL
jgi:hypothetical protein